MELKTIKKNQKELELEIIDENETILNPIIEILLENEDVDYAAYFIDNPESNKRRLYVRVKKGSPEDFVKKAVKFLEEEVKEFSKSFESKSKSKK